MASRHPTLALLILLAMPLGLLACATSTSQGPVQSDPVYLRGVSSEYSLRLDEIRPNGDHAHALPDAVVAGDNTVAIVASLFVLDDNYTMDLVIQNLGNEPFDLHRDDIRLRDDAGAELRSIEDWSGAETHGLRSQTRQRAAQGTIRSGERVHSQSHSEGSQRVRGKPGASRAPVDVHSSTVTDDFDWVSGLVVDETTAPERTSIHVLPRQGQSLWAYWKAEDVEFPLYAVISVNDRRLLMKFEKP